MGYYFEVLVIINRYLLAFCVFYIESVGEGFEGTGDSCSLTKFHIFAVRNFLGAGISVVASRNPSL